MSGGRREHTGQKKRKRRQRELKHFTFHLFDTSQSVLEGVQRAGLVIMSLLSGQMKLQLLQCFNHLLLGLGFGRLLTTTMAQPHTCTAAGQILHNDYLTLKKKINK